MIKIIQFKLEVLSYVSAIEGKSHVTQSKSCRKISPNLYCIEASNKSQAEISTKSVLKLNISSEVFSDTRCFRTRLDESNYANKQCTVHFFVNKHSKLGNHNKQESSKQHMFKTLKNLSRG